VVAKSSEVEAWFKERKPPAEKAMRRVRDLVLGADPGVTEYVKYGSVQFAYDGDMATFVKHGEKKVSLMFNRGARIKGTYPHLEGSHPSGRWIYFADEKEVDARSKELTDIVRAWIAMTPKERGNR
jgi:hypothetical protein